MARVFAGGSSQSLECSESPVSALPITFSCWYNTDNTADLKGLMRVQNSSGYYHQLALMHSGYGAYVAMIANDGSASQADSSTTYSVGVWQHACGVEASTTSRAAYINGGSKGTNSTSRTISSPDETKIGSFDGGYYMYGGIAEAAIWNAALTDFEVWLQAKLRLSPLWIRPQNLVFYSALLNNEDYDIVGRRKLTAVNGPTVAAHPPGIIYPPQPFGWAGPKSPRNINLLGRGLM